MGVRGTHCALSLVCDGVEQDMTWALGHTGVSLSHTLHPQQDSVSVSPWQYPAFDIIIWFILHSNCHALTEHLLFPCCAHVCEYLVDSHYCMTDG